MPEPSVSPIHEQILGILTHRGIASSSDLQAATGKSQATVSRAVSDLSSRILTLGRARAVRYALPQSIRGWASQQPILWTGEDGAVQQLGTLSFLAGNLVHIESGHVRVPTASALPWFLMPLKAQGFLGRLHAQRLETEGLGGDPEQWGLEDVLFSALHLHDASGAVTLGTGAGTPVPHPRLPTRGRPLQDALDTLATDVSRTLPAGSSAGGEQPKFLAVLESGQHVLVKFTPPRGTPFGERWHDLLHAECLASQVLEQHGVAVARVQVIEGHRRTFLVSERFDRIGERGRRHVISIGDAHDAFVPVSRTNWSATAEVLARQRRLDPLDASRITALRAFGHLIGNTDMHAGNLALFVGLEDLAPGRLRLAPIYDMLPMRWRPQPQTGGAPDYEPFEPDGQSLSSSAIRPAMDFWTRLAEHGHVSRRLRHVAAAMAGKIASAGTR
jgi:hypothetical protein